MPSDVKRMRVGADVYKRACDTGMQGKRIKAAGREAAETNARVSRPGMFDLEDRYGLTIEDRNGEILFRIDPRKGKDAARISEMVCVWAPVAEKFHAGEISREEYNKWRYNYPQYDDTQITATVPSQEFNDAMVNKFKARLK